MTNEWQEAVMHKLRVVNAHKAVEEAFDNPILAVAYLCEAWESRGERNLMESFSTTTES